MGIHRGLRSKLLVIAILANLGLTTLAQSSGVGSIVSSDQFNSIFPSKDPFYTYDAFITAAGTFPSFGTGGDTATQTRDVAAFFANVYHETAGLVDIREKDPPPGYYCQASTQYPCASDQEYYGRGPLQLSWNYNYGPAGQAIGEDLLNNPDLVATDAVVSFKASLWFWTTEQPPKPACEAVMDGSWTPSASDSSQGRLPGFGMTINVINGGLECGPSPSNTDGAADRVSHYRSICSALNVDPGSNLDCSSMTPYPP